jgi:ketosteroid isomerase-like protein
MNDNLLREAYQAFNARDIDAVLAVLHPNVVWANGMGGRYVHGLCMRASMA